MKKASLKAIGTLLAMSMTITNAIGGQSNATTNQLFAQLGGSISMLGSDSGLQTLGLIGYRYVPSWYYAELDVGGWKGSRQTGIVAGAVGLDYKDLSIGIGPGYISTITSSLGTHLQFLSTLRWTFNPWPIYIAFNHVSNGKAIYNWAPGRRNHGENFISVGTDYRF